ncbi:MAG: hypothetical protein ACPGGE_05390 [Poseidonia sp.]
MEPTPIPSLNTPRVWEVAAAMCVHEYRMWATCTLTADDLAAELHRLNVGMDVLDVEEDTPETIAWLTYVAESTSDAVAHDPDEFA